MSFQPAYHGLRFLVRESVSGQPDAIREFPYWDAAVDYADRLCRIAEDECNIGFERSENIGRHWVATSVNYAPRLRIEIERV